MNSQTHPKEKKMLRLTKKKFVLGAATVCVMAIAAGAYAYFTTTGSGTATATVGSASAVTIKGTVAGNLYPGSSSTVTFTVDNPSTAKQRVGTISVTKVEPDASHSTCVTTFGEEATKGFYMAPVEVNAVYAPGNGQAVTPTGTLKMNNMAESQDGCQGATLTLVLEAK
jgi:hypothetical protein